MKIGNQNPTDPVMLYQDNIRLAEFFVKKYFPNTVRNTYLYEELAGEARIALWRVANSFDQSKGKFTTYAAVCIRGYLLKYYNRVYKKQAFAFENYLNTTPEDCTCTRVDILASNDNTERQALLNVASEEVKRIIKKRYKTLQLYYFDGLTQAQIAKMQGKSQIAVSRDIQNTLKVLKKELKMA